MSTKAEEFRYWQERSGPKRPKASPAAENGGGGKKGGARESLHADRKAAYVLEDSQTRAKRWTAEVRPEGRATLRGR